MTSKPAKYYILCAAGVQLWYNMGSKGSLPCVRCHVAVGGGNTSCKRPLLLDGKIGCGACKQPVYLCFWLCGVYAQPYSDGTFCSGPFGGLQLIKLFQASHFRPGCFMETEQPCRSTVRSRKPRQFFFCTKKDCRTGKIHVRQSFYVFIPALPAAPARSRCSGICRWS